MADDLVINRRSNVYHRPDCQHAKRLVMMGYGAHTTTEHLALNSYARPCPKCHRDRERRKARQLEFEARQSLSRSYVEPIAVEPVPAGQPAITLYDPAEDREIPAKGLIRPCPHCRTPIDLRRTGGDHDMPTALQPGEYPARHIPAQLHRQLLYGLVYPGRGDGWVRIPHHAVCPARPEPEHPGLRDMWRALAIRRRRREAS
ncbi:DUF6083 domain-containing protein [Streptomyces sp. NPDC002754]